MTSGHLRFQMSAREILPFIPFSAVALSVAVFLKVQSLNRQHQHPLRLCKSMSS